MSFQNPDDSSEILYGSSGDVRNELNAHLDVTTGGHYADEREAPGALIIRSLRDSTRLINGYLEPVYVGQIPFTASGDVPKLLEKVSTDIATFYVLRSITARVGPVSDTKRRDYYDEYIKPPDGLLVKIAERKIQLPELTAQYPEDAKKINVPKAPIFGIDETTSHEPHPDSIEELGDDRAR